MKKLIQGVILITFALQSFSQYTEFEKSENGLIYSPTTVKQLKFIVDSLNLKFKVCDLHKTYRAKAQAKAHYVSLETGDIKAAQNDIESGISFDEFARKYPNAEADKDLLVVKFRYRDYENKNLVEFSSIELGGKHNYELTFDENSEHFNNAVKGKWILKRNGKTEYSKESIEAFYLITEFDEPVLANKYARLVQYAECMVDTSAEIFYEKAQRTGVRFYSKEPSLVRDFINYVHSKLKKPEYSGDYNEAEYAKFMKRYNTWDSLRQAKVDSLQSNDSRFSELFTGAVKEALEKGGSNDEFEEYVGRYQSKKTALELKRNRIVVGGCSMDNSPRIHAMNIALLSAETVNWETFLRSHLDIMNDNFQRVSDGSYAWAGRKTYIKELEILDINVPELLLGISLRVENPSQHHYYGNIGRLGRALSESQQLEFIDTKILELIRDNQLDDYNRVLMYYLYLNYNYYLESKEQQKKNILKLKDAVRTMPDYIGGKIKFK